LTVLFIKVTNINFIKIRPVGAALMYGDRRTDMTKIMGAFRNYANAPEYKFPVSLIKTTT